MNDTGRLSRALLRASTPDWEVWQDWIMVTAMGMERLGGREARGDGLSVFEAFEGSGQLTVKFKI